MIMSTVTEIKSISLSLQKVPQKVKVEYREREMVSLVYVLFISFGAYLMTNRKSEYLECLNLCSIQ